jgi:hypothetical protein
MKEIIIKNQKELDALPDSFNQYQEIYINSDPNSWLKITKTPQNAKIILRESSHALLRESSHALLRESSHAELWESSHAELWESSHAVLRGSSHAVLSGSSHAELRESSHALLWGSSHAELWESSHAELRESSHALLWGSSHAELWESSHAELRESSHALLRESSHAVLWGSSHAVLWGSSHAVLWGSSHAELWGSSHAELRESSHAELRESSHAVLRESSHAVLRGNSSAKALDKSVTVDELLEQATLICIDKKCNIQKKERTATIIISPKVFYNIKSFCDIYGKNLISEKEIILYKTVRPANHRDFYTNSIEYKGEVVCPDFKDDPKIQCGYGLHLSPTPEFALTYNKGTVLKCVVNIKDIVVFGTDITKVRCQKVKVIGEI